jgi:hypothetical protein
MTDKEKIIAEIERLINDKTDGKHVAEADITAPKRSAYLDILNFINSLPAEQNEDLEEASDKYANDHTGLCLENDGGLYEDFDKPKRDFIAGANWQKEQMLKSAIDAKIVNDEMSGCVVDCEQGCLVLERHTYPIGQKLKIAIIKEDGQ